MKKKLLALVLAAGMVASMAAEIQTATDLLPQITAKTLPPQQKAQTAIWLMSKTKVL